jgi:RNA 3'-terminal phosphate cyclase (ATP)
MLEIDGSYGEGGGQILRTALTLSVCTGTPFRITNIRAGRRKPGLLRQHLTAVVAAAEIASAEAIGAAIGSQTLTFIPQGLRGGDYHFAIGSAGSCTLVLQTILPALWQAKTPSRVVLEGGTHNPLAPPADFLERAFLPLLRRMGVVVSLTLERHGFYPAGGGRLVLEVEPAARLQALHLPERGVLKRAWAEALFAGIPAQVGKRELSTLGNGLGWNEDQLHLRQIDPEQGPGNVLLATLEHEQVTEVVCGFGEKSVSAEAVARGVVHEVNTYLDSRAAVGQHLADQLLLPMALAGAGSFSLSVASAHTRTNAEVISRFLPVAVELHESGQLCQISICS